jgi:hypothetical protein
VRNSEIKVIIEENPDLFSESRNNDADFNTLAIYILWEKIKEDKSFYFPWFNITDENYSMYEWTIKELDLLDD